MNSKVGLMFRFMFECFDKEANIKKRKKSYNDIFTLLVTATKIIGTFRSHSATTTSPVLYPSRDSKPRYFVLKKRIMYDDISKKNQKEIV